MPVFLSTDSKISANVGLFANFPNAAIFCSRTYFCCTVLFTDIWFGVIIHGNTFSEKYS